MVLYYKVNIAFAVFPLYSYPLSFITCADNPIALTDLKLF